jgi:hypothetical protein
MRPDGRLVSSRRTSPGSASRTATKDDRFSQLKEEAPSEWSFGSLGEDEEIDDADWWKTRS